MGLPIVVPVVAADAGSGEQENRGKGRDDFLASTSALTFGAQRRCGLGGAHGAVVGCPMRALRKLRIVAERFPVRRAFVPREVGVLKLPHRQVALELIDRERSLLLTVHQNKKFLLHRFKLPTARWSDGVVE